MSLSLRRSWLKTVFRSGFAASAARPKRRSRPLVVEELEARLTPNAYLVNVPGDASGLATGTASSDGNPLHGDLRYVLNKAIADQQTDTITFDATVFHSTQTITLSSSLVTAPSGFTNPYGQTAFIVGVSDNITIDGSLGANTPGITLAGGSATRLFAVEGGGSLTLQNLALSGGSATGGFGGIGGGGGGSAGLGGAVLVDGSTFTAAGCTFVNNQATGGAGGGRGDGSGFAGGGGGGGLGAPNAGDGTSNGKGGMGGGVNGGTGGFGGGGGGGESRSFGGGPGLGGFGGSSGFAGAGGGGGGLGGAVFATSGTVTLNNDTFTLNKAQGGSSGYPGGSGSSPAAQGDGGALFVRNGTLTATFVTFSGNTVTNGDSTTGRGSDLYVLSDAGSGTGFSGGTATAHLSENIPFVAKQIGGAAPPTITGTNAVQTTVSSSPNPSLFGQKVTFTATVTRVGGSGTPTGTVDFTEGAMDLTPGGVTLNGSGVATFTVASLAVGSNTITADYSGDRTFINSSGNDSPTPQVVNSNSRTTVTFSPASPSRFFGNPVTLTATVAPVSSPGTPSGTATFKDGSTTLASKVTLNASGVATFSTSALNVGNNTITAVYSGDTNFAASTSSGAVVSITAAVTGTTLSQPGAVILTASFSPHPSTISVKPLAGNINAGTSLTFPGPVTLQVTQTALQGATTIHVSALTNGSGAAGASAPVNFSSGISVYGQANVRITATVKTLPGQGSGSPTAGSVLFTDVLNTNATKSGTFQLGAKTTITLGLVSVGAGGEAVLNESGSPALVLPGIFTAYKNNGQRADLPLDDFIEGRYVNGLSGGPSDRRFAPSANPSAPFPEAISQDPTATSIAASESGAPPFHFGMTATLTATVRSLGGSSIGPIGTVTFMDTYTVGGVTKITALGTVTLPSLAWGVTSATVTLKTSTLAQAAHTLTAVYNGDNTAPFPLPTSFPYRDEWLASKATGTINVQPSTSTWTLSPNATNNSTFGSSVTFVDSLASGTDVTPQGGAPTTPQIALDQLFSSTTANAQHHTPLRLAETLGNARSADDWLTGPF
jgi:Bacterial Ig-like domain (group 3)